VRTGSKASLSLTSPWIIVRWSERRELATPGCGRRRRRTASLEEVRARAMQR
jgi:hypothetical protein